MSSYTTLQPFRLERWFAEFEFVTGMRNLAASCPFDVTTQELLALEGPETTSRYLSLTLGYVENPGNERLRQGVADLYTTLNPDDIQITSGASEALFLLIWTMAEEGANIVIEDPCYESVAGIARSRGMEVRRISRSMKRGWQPDFEQLSQLIDQKTRLVYFSHAHHPSGAMFTREEMRAIAQMTKHVGAVVVSDEVFRLTALDGTPAPSLVDVVEEDGVVIADMTKPWGLGGLRTGWIACRNRHLLQRISSARDYTTLCGSAPGEFLAEVTLRHIQQVITPRLESARINRAQLAEAIAHSEGILQWFVPSAGYTAFVQFPFPTTDFCRYLAQEKRVLLLPGQVYGDSYAQFVRIGFGGNAQHFQEGLAILMDELKQYRYI